MNPAVLVMADNMIYHSAESLWLALITRAGLDVGGAEATGRSLLRWRKDRERSARGAPYDVGLADDLRAALFGSAEGSLLSLLKTSKPPISAETLLRAFLRALQPFALMKVDILEMLSAAGARASDSNIKIRFQFDESEDPLDLLLQEFREQIETVERVAVEVRTCAWTPSDFWRLPRVAEDLIGGYGDELMGPLAPGDDVIQRWRERYMATRRYEPFPEMAPLGFDPLDVRLRTVVALLQDMLAAFRRHGDDRDALRDAGYGPSGETIDPIGLSIRDLYLTESDLWVSAMAEWLLRLRAAVLSPRVDRALLVAKIVKEVDAIIPPADGPTSLIEQLQSRLDEILNLPIWKRRNEVYAVWIGSQIWQALKNAWDFRFHVHDDTLSFAFGGVHLATLIGANSNDVIQWWTELRTPATRLPSGKRTTGIQPDYRLQRAPFSHPESDVLIVEVKQYKQSGKANFVAAIEDYAFACPKARVILANYGPISAATVGALSASAQQRSGLFSHVRPDRAAEASALREAMLQAVPAALGRAPVVVPTARAAESEVVRGTIHRVELTWDSSPRDLDLHVLGDDGQGLDRIDVHYGDPLYRTRIVYHGDVTNGFGPETVSVDDLHGSYLVCVHQFSLDGSIATGDVEVKIFRFEPDDPESMYIHCSGTGSGRWWIVCRLDCFSGAVTPIDRLVSDPWAWRRRQRIAF